jgi:hypothetical protein
MEVREPSPQCAAAMSTLLRALVQLVTEAVPPLVELQKALQIPQVTYHATEPRDQSLHSLFNSPLAKITQQPLVFLQTKDQGGTVGM